MKRSTTIAMSIVTIAFLFGGCGAKQNPQPVEYTETITLLPRSAKAGADAMQAFAQRSSAVGETIKGEPFTLQDLSDLLWATYGVNRPEVQKLTAPTSMNSQEASIYAIFQQGAYLYSPAAHALQRVSSNDLRAPVTANQPEMGQAPLILLVVGHTDRLKAGDEAMRKFSASIDGGIISQNISLFCAAKGWKTRPRTSMDRSAIAQELNLDSSALIIINHPISY